MIRKQSTAKRQPLLLTQFDYSFPRRFPGLLFLFIAFCFIPLLSVASPSLSNHRDSFHVHWQDGFLTVKAEQIDLGALLAEIARQSGIRFQDDQSLKKKITIEFENLPEEEGIKRLVGDVSITFQKNKDTGQVNLETVTIVPSATDSALPAANLASEQMLDRIRALAGSNDNEGINELTGILRNANNPSRLRVEAAHSLIKSSSADSADVLIEVLRNSTDKNLSYSLVSMLGSLPSHSSNEFLSQLALTNNNPTLRYKAIQSLTKSSSDTEGKISVLKKAALDDPDHYNRARAIMALAETGGKKEMDFFLSLQKKERDPFVTHVCAEQINLLNKN